MISVDITVFRGSHSLIGLKERIMHKLNMDAYDHEIIIVEAQPAR